MISDYLESEYYPKLTELIKDSYQENNNQKVNLLCHSMGCLVSLIYLNSQSTEFKNQYIECFITLAGAYGGSSNSLLGLTYGYDFHLNLSLEGLHGFRSAARTQPSSFFMLPNSDIFPSEKAIASFSNKQFKPSQLSEFFKSINFSEGEKRYEDAMNKHDVKTGPGVDVHCLYGSDVSTIEKVKVPNLESIDQPVKPDQIEYGDGDGVVNAVSLEVCNLWKDNNNGFPVKSESFSTANHMSILNDHRVHNYFLKLIFKKIV